MQLGCFERKILSKIYGPSHYWGEWQRTNSELYQLYHDDDIVKFVKLCRLQWAGNVMWRIWWEGQIEEETARVGCKGWKATAVRRDQWKALLKKKAHPGL
jgi:hypothetical protein